MTFAETKENRDDNCQLALWPNTDSKLFIEIQPVGNTDAYQYQCITLNKTDTLALIKELQRIIEEFELNDE